MRRKKGNQYTKSGECSVWGTGNGGTTTRDSRDPQNNATKVRTDDGMRTTNFAVIIRN